tara:strand:- start:208 stop:426 length:219 start_codon:yes stop_codon:yes gene_type:complete
MVGKSIVHRATGAVGIVTEYHPIPENTDLTGIIIATYPGVEGAAPYAQTYIVQPNRPKEKPIKYEIVDCSNS